LIVATPEESVDPVQLTPVAVFVTVTVTPEGAAQAPLQKTHWITTVSQQFAPPGLWSLN
jgi:hypothetical protein